MTPDDVVKVASGLGGALVTAFAGWFWVRRWVNQVDTKLDQLLELVPRVAVVEERTKATDKRVDDLASRRTIAAG